MATHLVEFAAFTGTNISFKREVFEKVGLFDTRLGPGASGFSEDTEYSRRIRQVGFKIGYAPNAIVYHELNPERYGSSYNRKVQYRKGVSRSIYRERIGNDACVAGLSRQLFSLLGLYGHWPATKGI